MTNLTFPYVIKLFQDILILVTNSCSVVTVMQMCGMMKKSQKILELQIQDSVYVVECLYCVCRIWLVLGLGYE